MNEEYSYIFYTFFKNLQEMKEKPPWCLFEIYHMYGFHKDLSISPDSSSTGVIQTSVLIEQSQQQYR